MDKKKLYISPSIGLYQQFMSLGSHKCVKLILPGSKHGWVCMLYLMRRLCNWSIKLKRVQGIHVVNQSFSHLKKSLYLHFVEIEVEEKNPVISVAVKRNKRITSAVYSPEIDMSCMGVINFRTNEFSRYRDVKNI